MNTTHWQNILARNRQTNFKQRRYDLCLYWQALALREHAGQPETLRRAYAFKNVLEHLPIVVDEGLVFGNCLGLRSDALPPGVTPEEYQALAQEYSALGQRDFWAGFDHSLADYPTLLAIGVQGYRQRVQEARRVHPDQEAQDFLQAVDVTLEAFSDFIQRMSQAARRQSSGTLRMPGDSGALSLSKRLPPAEDLPQASGSPSTILRQAQDAWMPDESGALSLSKRLTPRERPSAVIRQSFDNPSTGSGCLDA